MSTTLKYILITLAALIVAVIAAVIYRMFFQFNASEIRIYAREQAQKYGAASQDAYDLIMDAVDYILSSHNLTQQVLTSAKASNIDLEQELVNAALNQCISFKYLQRP